MRAWVTCWESEKRKTSEVKRENNTEIVETKVFFFFSNKSITQLFYIKLLLGKKIYRFFKDFFCLVKA